MDGGEVAMPLSSQTPTFENGPANKQSKRSRIAAALSFINLSAAELVPQRYRKTKGLTVLRTFVPEPPSPRPPPLILINGLPGMGKSTIAHELGKLLTEPVMPCPKEDVWLGGKEKKDSGKNKQPAVIVPPLYPFPAVETHGNGSVVVLNMSDIRSGQEQKERATKNGKDSGRSEETSTSASIQSSLVWTWPNALIYAGANSGNSSNDDDNDGDNDDEGRGDIVSGRRPYQAPSPRVQAIFDHVLKKETLGRLVIVTDTLYHGDASGFAAYENVPRACGRPLVTVGLSCAPGEHIARLGHRAATATAFHRAQAEAEQRPGPTPLSAAEHQRMRDAVWAMHDVGSATERRPYRFCALPKRRMRPSHQQRAVQNHFWRRNRSSSSGSGSGSDGNRNSSSSNRSPMEGPSTPTLMAAPLDVTDLTAREAAECILRYACEVGAFGDPAAEKRAAEKEAAEKRVKDMEAEKMGKNDYLGKLRREWQKWLHGGP